MIERNDDVVIAFRPGLLGQHAALPRRAFPVDTAQAVARHVFAQLVEFRPLALREGLLLSVQAGAHGEVDLTLRHRTDIRQDGDRAPDFGARGEVKKTEAGWPVQPDPSQCPGAAGAAGQGQLDHIVTLHGSSLGRAIDPFRPIEQGDQAGRCGWVDVQSEPGGFASENRFRPFQFQMSATVNTADQIQNDESGEPHPRHGEQTAIAGRERQEQGGQAQGDQRRPQQSPCRSHQRGTSIRDRMADRTSSGVRPSISAVGPSRMRCRRVGRNNACTSSGMA